MKEGQTMEEFHQTIALVSHIAEAHAHETHDYHNLMDVFKEAGELIIDPAHAITEIFYSLLFDLLIIPVFLFLYRKTREQKLRQEIHEEIDKEHGIDHDKKISELAKNNKQ